jgi:hypothetical protein
MELYTRKGWSWLRLAESSGCILCQKLLWLNLSYKLFSLKRDIEPTTESIAVVWPKPQDSLSPNQQAKTIQGFYNRVRVHAAHDREHNYHDSSTLCRGGTHSPWVMIILGSQVPVDPMEYLYTLPGCALGHHYKAFKWLPLIWPYPLKFHWRC